MSLFIDDKKITKTVKEVLKDWLKKSHTALLDNISNSIHNWLDEK